MIGREHVARFYAGLARLAPSGTHAEHLEVNGWDALVLRVGGVVYSVVQLETDGERIHAIRATLNPDKLSRI